jgi:hypothetical protein
MTCVYQRRGEAVLNTDDLVGLLIAAPASEVPDSWDPCDGRSVRY